MKLPSAIDGGMIERMEGSGTVQRPRARLGSALATYGHDVRRHAEVSVGHSTISQLEDALDRVETDLDRALAELRVPELGGAVQGFAHELLAQARALHNDGRRAVLDLGALGQVDVRNQLNELLEAPIIVAHLDYYTACEGVRKTAQAATRARQLLRLLIAAPLGPVSESYLKRVASLYLWGFDLEVYPLARSALDSVLQGILTNIAVRRLLTLPETQKVHLYDRIQAAAKQGWLDAEAASLADDIRDAGNDFLHFAPKPHSHIADPLSAIRALKLVLEQLSPHLPNG